MFRRGLLLSSLLAAVGCGGGGTPQTSGGQSTSGTTGSASSSGTSGSSSAGNFTPAAHEPLPVIVDRGGPVWSPLNPVTIRLPGARLDLGADVDVLLSAGWFEAVGAEYGVAGGQHLANYEVPDPSPSMVSGSDVKQLIMDLIDAGSVPPPAIGTVYAIEYPSSTTVTWNGATSCTSLGGYHGELVWGDAGVPYAVVFDCPTGVVLPDPVQSAEIAASHELLEVATDPFPITNPAYQLPTDLSDSWDYEGITEFGDFCTNATARSPLILDGGTLASRIWSNRAADAGPGDPCIPGDVYYSVTTDASQVVNLGTSASEQTVSVTLTGWSTASTADWYVHVEQGFGTFPLTVSLSNSDANGFSSINNGRSLTLTMIVPANVASLSFGSVLVGCLPSEQGSFASFIPVVVLVQ
jgi:hypothetical protein